jgi:hypothetical protein
MLVITGITMMDVGIGGISIVDVGISGIPLKDVCMSKTLIVKVGIF